MIRREHRYIYIIKDKHHVGYNELLTFIKVGPSVAPGTFGLLRARVKWQRHLRTGSDLHGV